MQLMSTGNAELDLILDGGLTAGSLVVLAGEPGAGKTVLAQQVAFHAAAHDGPVRYYTTLSESHTKLQEHLRGFSFFDPSALADGKLAYLSVTDLVTEDGGFAAVLDMIVREAFEHSPSLVVLDSAKALRTGIDGDALRHAVFQLASRVSHTGAVVMLVGEYDAEDVRTEPEFAVADCIIELSVREVVDDERRTLRVRKLRGRRYLAGYHATRITGDGHQLLPRLESIVDDRDNPGEGQVAFGLEHLDTMVDGGLPRGDISLVTGPSGVGKTLLGLHLVRQGLAEGERCLYLSAEESNAALRAKIATFGWDDALEAIDDGRLQLLTFTPVNLDIDNVGNRLQRLVAEHTPGRVVIDGMAELTAAIERVGRGPRALWALSHLAAHEGAAVMFTLETDPVGQRRTEVASAISALFDNVISLQYAEGDGSVQRAVHVTKMRRRAHDASVAGFTITGDGLVVTEPMHNVTGILGYDVMTIQGADR